MVARKFGKKKKKSIKKSYKKLASCDVIFLFRGHVPIVSYYVYCNTGGVNSVAASAIPWSYGTFFNQT